MSSTGPLTVQPAKDDHWKFLRDVLVFQLKMFLDNVRDFALMPVSLGAALIDLDHDGPARAQPDGCPSEHTLV